MVRESGLPSFLKERRLPSQDPRAIRQALIDDLKSATGAYLVGFSTVTQVDGEFLRVQQQSACDDPEAVECMARLEGQPYSRFSQGAGLSDVVEMNRFEARNAEAVRHMSLYALVWEPLDFDSSLSMNAIIDTTYLGQITAFRRKGEPRFAEDELAIAQERAAGYVDLLLAAHQLSGTGVAGRALILLTPAGVPCFQCEQGAAWLRDASFSSALAELVEAVHRRSEPPVLYLREALVRLTEVSGGAGTLYCATVVPAPSLVVERFACLSKIKRQIIDLAVVGATAIEMARYLRRSPETVRTHLKQLYDQFDLGSRAELVAMAHSGTLRSILDGPQVEGGSPVAASSVATPEPHSSKPH